MSNVISVATNIITYLFTKKGSSDPDNFIYGPLGWLISCITANPYLAIGIICVVIGFVISVIRRIIRS